MLYLGCAVWAFRDWVGEVYPAGTRPNQFLQRYAERFTAVEGNTTFYSIPDVGTVDRWVAQTPETFRFCPKVPRIYSHSGDLVSNLPAALAFLQTMQRLGPRLGPLFLQLPPSYGPSWLPDLSQFLRGWPRDHAPIAVEVRHRDWFQPPHADHLNHLLRELGVGRVLLDTRPIYDAVDNGLADPQLQSERRKPRLPLQPVVTASFCLVRYISHPDLATNETYLLDWLPRWQQWLAAGKTLYLFIHCPDEARSPRIARDIYDTLSVACPSVPPLPWNSLEGSPSQLSLF